MPHANWKEVVKAVAPTIASVFDTPLAGLGLSALLTALQPATDSHPDPEQFLSTAFQAMTPDLLMKVKEADKTFAADIQRLGIDINALKVVPAPSTPSHSNGNEFKCKFKKWSTGVTKKWDMEIPLAVAVCGAFFYAEYWIFSNATAVSSLSTESAVLIGRILGSVDAAFMMLLTYRWGSSKTSERKTEIIAQQAESQQTTATTTAVNLAATQAAAAVAAQTPPQPPRDINSPGAA